MTEEITKTEPESFSPASADECIHELIDALPKSKRMEYIGHFNELAVVLHKLEAKAGIAAENRHKSL